MTRKTFKVDLTLLDNVSACDPGIDFFKRFFPDGIVISNDQDEMTEFVIDFLEKMDSVLDYQNAKKYLSWAVEEFYADFDGDCYDLFVNKSDSSSCQICNPQVKQYSYLLRNDPITFAVLLSDSKRLK